MLNKDEEMRLASCLGVLRNDVEKDPTGQNWHDYPGLDSSAQLWLAEKFYETHQELKAIRIEQEHVVVEEAKKVLMRVFGIDEGAAHSFIQSTSMTSRRPKLDVAKDIIAMNTEAEKELG
jgi:hypothetical protein